MPKKKKKKDSRVDERRSPELKGRGNDPCSFMSKNTKKLLEASFPAQRSRKTPQEGSSDLLRIAPWPSL
jgi:hypothetical protein